MHGFPWEGEIEEIYVNWDGRVGMGTWGIGQDGAGE